jgi:hypothetical protein
MFLYIVSILGNRLKPAAIFRRDSEGDPCSHANSMSRLAPFGNPLNEPVY